MSIVLLLFPDLALIVMGQLLVRYAGWSREFWEGAERLVYLVLFPVLLFLSILRTKFVFGETWPVLVVSLGASLIGIALALAARPLLKPVPIQFASGVQCAFRFNSYVALALSQRIGGEQGLALCAVIVGFTVPLVNIVAVYPLARHAGTNFARELLRNPLVLATMGGLLANFVGLQLPEVVAALGQRLGNAALAMGLLTVGAGLVLQRATDHSHAADTQPSRRSAQQLTIWFTAVKLIAIPASAWALALLFGLPPAALAIVVMFATMPTSSSCYILAVRMGGNGPFVAFLITVSTLASLVAMPLWLSLVS